MGYIQERSDNKNGVRYLEKGGKSFGPDITMYKGLYRAEIEGGNLENAVYTITSNLRDLNPSDIYGIKIPENSIDDVLLQKIGRLYLSDLQNNSVLLTREQKNVGTTQTQSFKISKSKPIIDEIDKVLASHYGFTEEELDFIINYDIKYRMGDELNDE